MTEFQLAEQRTKREPDVFSGSPSLQAIRDDMDDERRERFAEAFRIIDVRERLWEAKQALAEAGDRREAANDDCTRIAADIARLRSELDHLIAHPDERTAF